MEKVILNNNIEIPALGLGTYQSKGDEVQKAVEFAFEFGYRHIDTAAAYHNEKEIGTALKNSSIPRKEIFITTKLDNSDHGYENAVTACKKSLERLDTDYIDLYLIHWPSNGKRNETWEALETLYDQGLCRSIGVSNYTVKHLTELLQNFSTKPAVNQIEFNPFVYQKDIHDFCEKNNIQTEAYTPLARGKRFDEPDVKKLSEKYNKTPAQILLRWSLQHNAVVIPKSIHKERIEENSKIFDFEISSDDMQILNSKNEDLRAAPDPHEIK